ncbi:MAG TPA: class I SAM-dependent methyltransferase [Bacteroidales bacterium]|nr:class I SAM-dependent methyltransferase [Bacteroidales bacterium]
MKITPEDLERQFKYNQGKNLFFDSIGDSLKFSPETLKSIEKIDSIDAETESLLIDYLTNRAIEEFCHTNQYYTIDIQAKSSLRYIYVDLFTSLKAHKTSIDSVAKNHYVKISEWLRKTNAFAEKIYSLEGEKIEPVACSEYSPDLQIKILQIDINNILEPVLDIGCGREGNLVHFLRGKDIDAHGFDRFASGNVFLHNSDWFDYEFEKDKWGTITSNLGFSNHFQHNHFRNDGNYIDYARKYMEILNALKPGGSFHYAPDLPFIEQYLDKGKYLITKQRIGSYKVSSTNVKRLK